MEVRCKDCKHLALWDVDWTCPHLMKIVPDFNAPHECDGFCHTMTNDEKVEECMSNPHSTDAEIRALLKHCLCWKDLQQVHYMQRIRTKLVDFLSDEYTTREYAEKRIVDILNEE